LTLPHQSSPKVQVQCAIAASLLWIGGTEAIQALQASAKSAR
jgi:hypothetical protein